MQQRFHAVLLMPKPKIAVEVIFFLLECVVAIGMAACTLRKSSHQHCVDQLAH